MPEVIATQIVEVGMKVCNSRPFMTGFTFLSFVPISVVCLLSIKIYKFVLLIFKWMLPYEPLIKHPIILLIGPKNDTIEEMIEQLAGKFNSEIVNLQDINYNICKRSMTSQKENESRLIYSNMPITSQEVIIELSKYIQNTFGSVDILVIAQDENSVENNTTQLFLNHLNKQLLSHFWTVIAFLPGMLQRNKGYIISVALGKSSLINTGIMRSLHEELLQCETNVKMALVEINSVLENYLPRLPTSIKAKLIIRSMWNFDSVVKVPSLGSYLLMTPILFTRLMKAVIVTITRFISGRSF